MMSASAAAALVSSDGEAFALEEVRAEAVIDGLLAEVTVTQRYRNPEATNVEAVYTFPLPLEGVLLGLEVEIGDRRLAGVVVEKTEAERRYEDAITDGDAAVLLEQAEPGLYTASVGNLMPGERAMIRFRFGLLLRWNGDRVRFAMPTTIAPRYGDPLAAGLDPHQAPTYAFDAERAFGVRVAVRGVLRGARFNSPSHGISVAQEDDATFIALTGTPAMDRDFILEARIAQPEVDAALVARDFEGWVALASFRPEIPLAGHRQPRSVKIVIDCSGSMNGDSIAQARVALERILDGLHSDDRFEVIAFGGSTRAFFGRETPVSERTLAEARHFVRTLDADMGGTEIAAALEAAYRSRGESALPRDLLLITDGEVWNSGDVIERASRSGHRIFTIGVGSAVQESFVRGLAVATGGACEFVSPREDMAERIHRHFQRMYAPGAQSATIHWPAAAVHNEPRSIETVHGGDTLHVFAWFAEKPQGEAALEVTLADGRVIRQKARIAAIEEHLTETPPSSTAALPALARIGAARRILAIDDARAGTELSIRYQLMSRWTNCVVVHIRADADKAEDLPNIVRIPQVLAAGWHGIGTIHREQRFERRPAFRRLAARLAMVEESTESGESEWERQTVVGATGPTRLVELLNTRGLRPAPTLDELEAWGVPEEVLVALRDLVDDDTDEAVIVAVFLFVVAESKAGRTLQRQVRRQILRNCKVFRPDAALIEGVRHALRSWIPAGDSPPHRRDRPFWASWLKPGRDDVQG